MLEAGISLAKLVTFIKTFWIFIAGAVLALWLIGRNNILRGIQVVWKWVFGGSDERGLRRYALATIACLLAFWGVKQALHKCPTTPGGDTPQTIVGPLNPGSGPVTVPGKTVTMVIYQDRIDIGPWPHNLHTTKVQIRRDKDTAIVLRRGIVLVPECGLGYMYGDDTIRPMLGARVLSWDRTGAALGISPTFVAAYLETTPFDSAPNLTFGLGAAVPFDNMSEVKPFGKAGVRWK